MRSLSTITISESVGQVLEEEGINYDSLVEIHYENGKISAITTNSVMINVLVRNITALVQNKLDALTGHGLQIALGTFTAIPFLYDIGPNVNLKLVPVSTVSTTFDSKFESAGINNTKHSLYFRVQSSIGVILPAGKKIFDTFLDVLICENIIAGDVPSVYLSS